MPDPLDAVVLSVRPEDASSYGWRIRSAALRTRTASGDSAPALGAS